MWKNKVQQKYEGEKEVTKQVELVTSLCKATLLDSPALLLRVKQVDVYDLHGFSWFIANLPCQV